MLSFLAKLGSFILDILNSPARARAKKQKVRAEIEHEVRSGDEDAVNRRLEETLKNVVIPLLLIIGLGGCGPSKPQIVYVNEPNRVCRMDKDGVSGWWVPDGRYIEMQEKIQNCVCQ